MIFKIKDVIEIVEIWRQVCCFFYSNSKWDLQWFDNIELLAAKDKANNEHDSILSEWEQLRRDSSLNLLLDSRDLDDFSALSEVQEDQDDAHNFE